MKRQMLTLEGWDKTTVKIPLPKNGYWWSWSHGKRCVVGCQNNPNTVYVSDYGLASMAYCEVHAEARVLYNLITGQGERGIWVQCYKGKLVPLNRAYDVIEPLLKMSNNTKVRNNLKKFQMKIKQFRRDQKK